MNLNYTGGFPAFFAGCPLPGPPLTPRAGWLIRLITRDQCKTGDQARSCINLVPTVSAGSRSRLAHSRFCGSGMIGGGFCVAQPGSGTNRRAVGGGRAEVKSWVKSWGGRAEVDRELWHSVSRGSSLVSGVPRSNLIHGSTGIFLNEKTGDERRGMRRQEEIRTRT